MWRQRDRHDHVTISLAVVLIVCSEAVCFDTWLGDFQKVIDIYDGSSVKLLPKGKRSKRQIVSVIR